MDLSNLKPPAGQRQKQRRVGRGMGSGRGKTSGRGQKGQHSISGFSQKRGFEGGQMPLHRRLPKRGFSNQPFKKEYAVINLSRLEKLEGSEFSPEALVQAGVVKKLGNGLKVLGTGELSRAITVRAHLFSESAKQKIESAGGRAEVVSSNKQA